MAGSFDDEELPEVQVAARDRNPGALTRVRRARETLAPGTFLPELKALFRPGLFQARADTNSLIEDAFAEDGPLGRLAAENPELVNELRQQAAAPMTTQEHGKFRSELLGLVANEVDKETKIRAQQADNQGFMQAFAALDAFIPGIARGGAPTLEESERRQIGLLFDQAQELALIDPVASQAIMVEVRKKADALSANVRQFMEKNRRDAQLEDKALYAQADEQIQETNDIIASLAHDRDERGMFKRPNEAIVARALAQLGRAGNLPSSGIGEVAQAVAPSAGTLAGGAGTTRGVIVDAAVGLGGVIADKLSDSKGVEDLIERLTFNRGLIEQAYAKNRAQLVDRYKPLGIEVGETPGEAYAVANEAYQAQADKIPEKETTPEQDNQDRTSALRTMLEDEQASADAAVEKATPDAAANLPGAAARLAQALARQRIAQDDRAIFEADLREAAGQDLTGIPGIDANVAQEAIAKARLRRQHRNESSTRLRQRQQTMEALRSHTR